MHTAESTPLTPQIAAQKLLEVAQQYIYHVSAMPDAENLQAIGVLQGISTGALSPHASFDVFPMLQGYADEMRRFAKRAGLIKRYGSERQAEEHQPDCVIRECQYRLVDGDLRESATVGQRSSAALKLLPAFNEAMRAAHQSGLFQRPPLLEVNLAEGPLAELGNKVAEAFLTYGSTAPQVTSTNSASGWINRTTTISSSNGRAP